MENSSDSVARRGRGRAPSTSKDELGRIGLELFVTRGFENVTVDDIARAAGIGRRTFFRYFPSKNDIAWGDFDGLLVSFAQSLATAGDVPVVDAIRLGVRRFNDVPDTERDTHRHRMRMLLTTPELVAHSTVRYADWRRVIADFVGERLGIDGGSPVPQAVSWACLGISLAAYEAWIEDSSEDLLALIDRSFAAFAAIFAGGALESESTR